MALQWECVEEGWEWQARAGNWLLEVSRWWVDGLIRFRATAEFPGRSGVLELLWRSGTDEHSTPEAAMQAAEAWLREELEEALRAMEGQGDG